VLLHIAAAHGGACSILGLSRTVDGQGNLFQRIMTIVEPAEAGYGAPVGRLFDVMLAAFCL
jgi:hypothetical protein